MNKPSSGSKVIVSKHWSHLYEKVGIIHSLYEVPSTFGRRWWVFFPDKLRDNLEHKENEDPMKKVCWLLWEDYLVVMD